MNTNNTEELINTLDPNTIQCNKCKKWFSKDRPDDYDHIRLYDICTKCSIYGDINKGSLSIF